MTRDVHRKVGRALLSVPFPQGDKNPAVLASSFLSSSHLIQVPECHSQSTRSPVMRLYKFAQKTGLRAEAVKGRTSAWKLGGLTPLQLVKRVYHEIGEDEVFTRSAALAYYFVSALFPMIFFLMAMLGLFSQSHDLQSSLLNYTARFMPGDAYHLVQKTLQEIANSSTGLKLAFGLVLALWSGAGGVVSIMDALNRCYHVKDSRPFWKQRLIVLGLIVAIAALTIVALTIVLYGGDIANFVGRHVGLSNVTVMAWHVLQWPIALLFVVISFALLYFWGP